jgi:hypothetical protein
MTRKIAASSALFVFAVSLLLGLRAENTFNTTLSRALLAMAVTFAVGLVIGAMAQRMMQEHQDELERNLSASAEKTEDSEAKPDGKDR